MERFSRRDRSVAGDRLTWSRERLKQVDATAEHGRAQVRVDLGGRDGRMAEEIANRLQRRAPLGEFACKRVPQRVPAYPGDAGASADHAQVLPSGLLPNRLAISEEDEPLGASDGAKGVDQVRRESDVTDPAPGKASAASAGRATSASSRKSGEKRSPEHLARTVAALAAYIAKNRGHSMEQMVKAMRMPKADLQLPIAKLLAAKTIRKTGLKRGTKYYAAKWRNWLADAGVP